MHLPHRNRWDSLFRMRHSYLQTGFDAKSPCKRLKFQYLRIISCALHGLHEKIARKIEIDSKLLIKNIYRKRKEHYVFCLTLASSQKEKKKHALNIIFFSLRFQKMSRKPNAFCHYGKTKKSARSPQEELRLPTLSCKPQCLCLKLLEKKKMGYYLLFWLTFFFLHRPYFPWRKPKPFSSKTVLHNFPCFPFCCWFIPHIHVKLLVGISRSLHIVSLQKSKKNKRERNNLSHGNSRRQAGAFLNHINISFVKTHDAIFFL